MSTAKATITGALRQKGPEILAALDLTAAPFDAARALLRECLPQTDEVLRLAGLLEEHADALREAAKDLLR